MKTPIVIKKSDLFIGQEVMIESKFTKGYFTKGNITEIDNYEDNASVVIKQNEVNPEYWWARRKITEVYEVDSKIIKSYKGHRTRWAEEVH